MDSDINLGIEIEYPTVRDGENPLVHRGRKSQSTYDYLNGEGMHPADGRTTRDGTVGLEVVSDVLDIEDAPAWYAGTVEWVEEETGDPYAPVSLVPGNTAGTHIHVSELDESTARDLYEISHEADVQVLACSAVIDEEAPNYKVFRDSGYCRMSFNSGRYSVVNDRGGGHYEWRLPEPQEPDKFKNVVEFLDILVDNGYGEALDYAEEKVEAKDTTAIERALEIGSDVFEMPSLGVDRNPHQSTADWFDTVFQGDSYPYIYRVDVEDEDTAFYAFHSDKTNDVSEVEGVAFDPNTVLDADSLEYVRDPRVIQRVHSVVEEYREQQGGPTKKEVTKRLEEAVK